MRDFLPEEQVVRQKIMDILRSEFELYGFRPLDTPAIESFEVLSAKYAGGEEILSETFSLTDRGKRKLGLRYDLTVPLSRFITENPQLKLPFKRYQIAKVWRDGPVGFGRYREFWQCDIDTIGSKSMKAEAEILAIADSSYKKIGLPVTIKVSNRKLLDGILDYLKVTDKKSAMVTIDKISKMPRAALIKEFESNGIKNGSKLLDFFKENTKLSDIKKIIPDNEGVIELEELFVYLKQYKTKVNFSVELARGLSYYTSTIFEVFLKKGKISSSLGGGGRYDKMIGNFAKQEYPAVGISFGLDRIYDALDKTDNKSNTQIYVIPIGTDAIEIVQELRNTGINAEIDISGKGISKNLNYANSLKIPYVIFVGEKEMQSGKFKLKEMESGKEQLLTLGQILKLFSGHKSL